MTRSIGRKSGGDSPISIAVQERIPRESTASTGSTGSALHALPRRSSIEVVADLRHAASVNATRLQNPPRAGIANSARQTKRTRWLQKSITVPDVVDTGSEGQQLANPTSPLVPNLGRALQVHEAEGRPRQELLDTLKIVFAFDKGKPGDDALAIYLNMQGGAYLRAGDDSMKVGIGRELSGHLSDAEIAECRKADIRKIIVELNAPPSNKALATLQFDVNVTTARRLGSSISPPRLMHGTLTRVFDRLTSTGPALRDELLQAFLYVQWERFLCGISNRSPESRADASISQRAILENVLKASSHVVGPEDEDLLQSLSAKTGYLMAEGPDDLNENIAESCEKDKGGYFRGVKSSLGCDIYRDSKGSFYRPLSRLDESHQAMIESQIGRPYPGTRLLVKHKYSPIRFKNSGVLCQMTEVDIRLAEKLAPAGSSSTIVVAKTVGSRTSNPWVSRYLGQTEMACLARLPEGVPQFSQCREFLIVDNKVMLFIDYAPHGDADGLSAKINGIGDRELRHEMELKLAEMFVRPIAIAHAHGVFHLDAVGQNYMVSDIFHLMLIDFGQSSLNENGGVRRGRARELTPDAELPDGSINTRLPASHGDRYLLAANLRGISRWNPDVADIARQLESTTTSLPQLMADHFHDSMSDDDFRRQVENLYYPEGPTVMNRVQEVMDQFYPNPFDSDDDGPPARPETLIKSWSPGS